LSQAGLNYYSTINLQYKGQVVAKKRGAEDITADSLRTLQIMEMIAQQAAAQSADSVKIFTDDNNNNTADSSMVLQSIQRDDADNEAATANNNNPVLLDTIAVNPPPKKPAARSAPVSNSNPRTSL
jgi:hypothetical protein